MQRKTLLIALCCLLVVLVGLVALGVYMLSGDSDSNVGAYQKQLDLGEKYFEDEDYEQAIAAYLAAIEEDPSDDEAYYRLAQIYKTLGRMDDMRSILSEGLSAASSSRLKKLYSRYFDDSNSTGAEQLENKEELEDSYAVRLSSSTTQILANYTFKDYSRKYSGMSVSNSGGQCVITFRDLGITFYYYDEGGVVSINTDAGTPLDDVRPNYMVATNLGVIFDGLTSGRTVSVNDLSTMGASSVSESHDTSLGNYVKFEYNHCIFEIAIDASKSFSYDSDNRIFSEFGTGASESEEEDVFTNSITIVSATTGSGVPNADVYVREGENINGDVIYTTRTDSSGVCTLQLTVGVYNVEVTCEGFIVEAFVFEIYSSGICSVENFTVSPELAEGELRIVLEWGDYPFDVDSFLIDEYSNTRVYYGNRGWYENGETVAELDVDDRNGYGPETITVYDTSRDFTYYVHDYSDTGMLFSRQDVTVKVYIPGQSAPEVYVIPTSGSDNRGWCVFSWIDGRIVVRGHEVYERDSFSHVS